FSQEGSYQAMIIEKLGPSLDKVLEASPDGTLKLHHVTGFGLQMVNIPPQIHSHHFVHRDIKPQNMLTSIEGSKNTVYLINFDIAKRYRHPSSRIHIPISQRFKDGTLIGTPAFTSVNSHLRLELSQRDDLESLAYTLLFLYTGSLPWLAPLGNQTCWSTSAIHWAKEAITTKYCPSMPSELLTLLLL
ncbi:kinase-like protein, partial [Gyrodon lividus]